MIFFLNRSRPIQLHQSFAEKGRSILLGVRKCLGSKYGGARAVQENLARELALQKDFFWAQGNGATPDQPVDVAWALSSAHDMAHAFKLKKAGLVKNVWGGPNLVVVPQEAAGLLSAEALDAYLVPCAWVADFYLQAEPTLKNKLSLWPVGIDTDYWKDTFHLAKNTLLIYNKNQSDLARLVQQQAQALKIETRMINYGDYTPDEYRSALARTRGMVWLSNSETQGLACLEALSMNIPVLAWNPGQWNYRSVKMRRHFSCGASSVPYFDATCGETFQTITEFSDAWTRFSNRSQTYQPRDYVIHQQLDLKTNLQRLHPLHSL